jgi:hypothetical protein
MVSAVCGKRGRPGGEEFFTATATPPPQARQIDAFCARILYGANMETSATALAEPTGRQAPYVLTEVIADRPGLRRFRHGLVRHTPLSFLRRGVEVIAEVTRHLAVDMIAAFRPASPVILRLEDGVPTLPEQKSIALYVHWSPDGKISAMVRQQVAAYAEAGFAVVFITAAPAVSEPDWQAMRGIAALLVHRRNAGRDFGAWKDAIGAALQLMPDAEELLLTNDSILGPILPLKPLWPILRAAGDGLVGLTESLGGGAHLQSYFLLFRGQAAIADAAAFLRRLRLSSSKWLIVQRGELGLTRHMLARGHRVMAVFGYERIATAIAADRAEREALIGADQRLAPLISLPDHLQSAAVINALRDRPLNLTHHLWAQLVRQFGFPFLKTDLISRNPHRLAGTESWPDLVGQDSPCAPGVIAEHLRRQAAKT